MFNRFFFILLTFLWSGCQYLSTVSAQTVIFNASPSAQPGDAINLQGNFGASAKVFLIKGSASAAVSLPILVQSVGQITAQIPRNIGVDLYQIWVDNAGENSQKVFVNRARGMHYDSPEITPGGTLRIFGRNLQLSAGAPQVRFEGQDGSSGGMGTVVASQSDAYTLTVVAPTTLQPGQSYKVIVRNGLGGVAGETQVEQPITAIAAGTDYFSLGVPWAAKFDFYKNVYNVKTDVRLTQKADGNGVTNDQPAIQAAINRARADGGGVVYLPAGTYKLVYTSVSGLEIPARVVVQGAGNDQTFLKYGYGVTSGFGYCISFAGNDRMGLADFSMENVNEQGQWRNNLVTYPGAKSDIFLRNVNALTSGESFTFIHETNRLLITGCRLVNKRNRILATDMGALTVTNGKHIIIRNTYIQHEVGQTGFNDGCSDLLLENNTFVRDAAIQYGPSPVIVDTRSLSINFAKNVAILNNHFETINGPAKDNTDGETILSEGGGPDRKDAYYGAVSGATSTGLRHASANWKTLSTSAIVVIIKGKGHGQWRYVTSNSTNELTIDRPWDVIPDATSAYSITNWSAENWLVKKNTLLNNRAGLELFNCAGNNVAIVENQLTNNDGILLRPGQTLMYGTVEVFNPIYNTQIIGNTVQNIASAQNTGNPAYIGLLPYQYQDEKTLGTSAIGVEVRNNTLKARPSYTISKTNNNELGTEGYYNYFLQQFIGTSEDTPVTLGTIFQNNTAVDCASAFYLSSGIYNTLLCNTTLTNVGKLVDDRKLLNCTQASVNTVTCAEGTMGTGGLLPIADPKKNAPIMRNAAATGLVALSGSSPNGQISHFTINSLPPPTQGTLFFKESLAQTVTSIPVDQANMLSFQPKADYTGEALFTYTCVDSEGMVSFEAPFVVPVTSTLPVELLEFAGKPQNAHAILNWKTASEHNNAYFQVERSLDARAFEPIKRVAGQLRKLTATTYTCLDADVASKANGHAYYRLKQVDLDSSVIYSPVISVKFFVSPVVAIYPNPVSNELHVLLPTAGGNLSVYSSAGTHILTSRTTTPEATLDVRKLPPGAYLLVIQNSQATQIGKRWFVKQLL